MKTTLNQIRAHRPCHDGWQKLLRGLGKTAADDEPLWIDEILSIRGLDYALWCLRAVKGCDREISFYAVWCARRVQHLMTDARSVAALDVAERYARNEASDEELASARGLAASASASASAALASALAPAEAWAAGAAAAAASAWALALASARGLAAYTAAAASASAWAAYTAAERTTDAAASWADRDTERAAQAEELRRVCREMREAGR
jgi:hypothetical protein